MCSKKSPILSILRWNCNLTVWNTTMKCISMLVVLVGIVNVAEFLLFFALSSCDNGQVDFRICKIHANKYFELLILVFFLPGRNRYFSWFPVSFSMNGSTSKYACTNQFFKSKSLSCTLLRNLQTYSKRRQKSFSILSRKYSIKSLGYIHT